VGPSPVLGGPFGGLRSAAEQRKKSRRPDVPNKLETRALFRSSASTFGHHSTFAQSTLSPVRTLGCSYADISLSPQISTFVRTDIREGASSTASEPCPLSTVRAVQHLSIDGVVVFA
jgi:hypothetical protein